MKYKIARNGQEIGEWTLEEIQAKLQSGELFASDMAWAPGMSNWMLLSQVIGGGQAAMTSIPAVIPTAVSMGNNNRPQKPDNNLVWSILVTIFCCWPFGIPSIVFAAKVDSAYNAGRYEEAIENARKSRMWMWISFGLGLFVIAIYALAVASGALNR